MYLAVLPVSDDEFFSVYVSWSSDTQASASDIIYKPVQAMLPISDEVFFYVS